MSPPLGPAELLDTRPPRPGRRILALLLGAVVVAGLIALAVHRSHTAHPRPTASAAPRPSPPSVSESPVTVLTAGPVVATAVGDSAYAVVGGAVEAIDLNTGATTVWRAGGESNPDVDYRVLADPQHQRLWVVRSGTGRVEISWFDTTDAAQAGVHVASGSVTGAAVLDGRLYVSTTAGLITLSQTEEIPGPPRLPARPAQVLAADPDRHRLLLAHFVGRRSQLTAARPGDAAPSVRAGADLGKGSLAVVHGRVWLAGFGEHGAVLEQLDPRTLRLSAIDPLAARLGPGAEIEQSAGRHLLVRGGGGDTRLWCLDAVTGAVAGEWGRVAGTPVLAEGGVYVLGAGRPLQHLAAGPCRG